MKELENGNTEWLMVTAGSAGGLIPGFLVEFSMDSKIAEVDGFHFVSEIRPFMVTFRTSRTSFTGSRPSESPRLLLDES